MKASLRDPAFVRLAIAEAAVPPTIVSVQMVETLTIGLTVQSTRIPVLLGEAPD